MNGDTRLFCIRTGFDLCQEFEQELEFQKTLQPSDSRHWKMFRWDDENKYYDIFWGGYEYSIAWSQLDSPMRLLSFVAHLGEKSWEHMTPSRIREFIESVSHRAGWDLWGCTEHPNRGTPNAQERAKLTPSLRWKILQRDGHRCRGCGLGPESGAILHIDHIAPISKGGLTIEENLRVLCAACNFGKRAD